MKRNILIISALFMAIMTNAQSAKEEVDFFQAAFGMEKKAFVDAFIETTEAQSDAFWQLYDEYETQRKTLGQQRFDLLNQYAEQYLTMTSEQADLWTNSVIMLQAKTDKLINTYYKKVKKISDGITAIQFYQIETYILTEIRAEILEDIPFVEK